MTDAEKDELHRHIQSLVFGRPRKTAAEFDERQDRLHALVDQANGETFIEVNANRLYRELEVVRAFVRRVHARASKDGIKYRFAINAELEAMEGADAR